MTKDRSDVSDRTREGSGDAGALAGHSLLVCAPSSMFAVPIPTEGSLTIGRADTCDVCVPDSSISRKHAVLHGGSIPTIEDLGSTNGTRAGGRKLGPGERAPAPAGTVIELGSVTVVVQRGQVTVPKSAGGARGVPAGVVVEDPTMKRLYRMIDVVAPTTMSVLILGETGVGKEVFAEAMHRRSARAAKPFLKLNCAALPESILESELFGHERGAFTGALATKVGLFESADGGTVFLDEVGDMPLTTQAKLLRVLESGEVLRVGSVKPRRIDVRFVSATNRDLPARSAEGHFRADLYFRLNGFAVTLPPLRERKDDIVALAQAFMRDARVRLGKPAVSFTPEAVAALQAYRWPGNIRELRNVIDRTALLCEGSAVRPEDIVIDAGAIAASVAAVPIAAPPVISAPSAPPPAPAAPPPVAAAPPDEAPPAPPMAAPSAPSARPPNNLRAEMESLERDRILAVLEQCAGNQSRAAKVLGISRRTLLVRLDAYGVARPRKGQDR